MDIKQIHLAVVQPFTQRTAGAWLVHLLPGVPHAEDRARRIRIRRFGFAELVALYTNDVGDQHRVVRGHGTTRLGYHRRMVQTVLITGRTNRPDHVVGVLIQAIVDRAVRLRTRSFVIDAQAAADIEAFDVNAQLRQFDVETRRLTHAGSDVADVGHLRTQMEVQQLQAVDATRFAHDLNQFQHLRRRQTKLRLFAAARLPFTGALRSQTRTDTETWHHIQTLRFFQHQPHFRHLLQHQIDLVAHLLADQRQTNIFTVFIAVTDDD